MKRLFAVLLLAVGCVGLSSCGSQSKSSPGADVTGNWNVDLTEIGQTTPSYSFGMKFSKNTATITGTEIPYTGGTQNNTGCVNYGSLTASGDTNGGSVITLLVKDSTTGSSFTISGTADSGVTQINGTFNATFGPNGSNPACPATSGMVIMNRQ